MKKTKPALSNHSRMDPRDREFKYLALNQDYGPRNTIEPKARPFSGPHHQHITSPRLCT